MTLYALVGWRAPIQGNFLLEGLCFSTSEESNWILPLCGGSDDPDEDDETPAERMRGLKDKDVLQEKCVKAVS